MNAKCPVVSQVLVYVWYLKRSSSLTTGLFLCFVLLFHKSKVMQFRPRNIYVASSFICVGQTNMFVAALCWKIVFSASDPWQTSHTDWLVSLHWTLLSQEKHCLSFLHSDINTVNMWSVFFLVQHKVTDEDVWDLYLIRAVCWLYATLQWSPTQNLWKFHLSSS